MSTDSEKLVRRNGGVHASSDTIDLKSIELTDKRPASAAAPAAAAGATTVRTAGGASATGGAGASGDPLYDAPVSDVWHSEFYDPPGAPVRRSNRRRLPLRTTATAFFLLFIGVLFGAIGTATVFTKSLSDAIPFLVIAGIGFIPGAYHSVIIVRAYLGHAGYSYDMVPSFDE